MINVVPLVVRDCEDELEQEDDGIYTVEYIEKIRRCQDGTLEVLVHWRGYPTSDDSWIPESYLMSSLHEYTIVDPTIYTKNTKKRPR